MPLHHQYIAELRKTEKHTHPQNRRLQFGSNLTDKLLRAECPSKPTLALRRPQAGVRPGRWRLRRVFGSPPKTVKLAGASEHHRGSATYLLLAMFRKVHKTSCCRNILNELWQFSTLVLFVFSQVVYDTFRQVYADCIASIDTIDLFADFNYW